MSRISIIVPVYNESENIHPLFYEIKKYCPEDFELIWVDDGSTDETLAEIQQLAFNEERIKCISLSRNFGHQNALFAGLNYAVGKYIITMDGDLQHPPSLIPQMLEKLKSGTDIVFTRKKSTKKSSWLSNTITRACYKIINFFSDTKIEENLTDYRAFNHKVLDSVLQFKEKETFLRGIFTWIGYKSEVLEFNCHERVHGKTKYSFAQIFLTELNKIIAFNPSVTKFITTILGLTIIITLFNVPLWPLLNSHSENLFSNWHIVLNLLVCAMQIILVIMIFKLVNISVSNSRKRPPYLVREMINF